MADSPANPNVSPEGPGRTAEYVVVARRYRPQNFEQLIGQEHVARALSNAIGSHRVGHAYLFTGARGVGKTSTARILAKALNCVHGPTAEPCNVCDICQSITSGDDVDVLEIDGASNRGIDEIRQLRQNVNIRPSRERFKIYIIDEVHMLTREAFNALLKTLEEPPEHVKFIFCTTEPGKIPITILSRCQRFDFAGIETRSIAERLRQIVEAEGVVAEPAALELLARRAAGSMRDSQSLLEQLLAFAPERITTADVNSMLGTAGEERLLAILDHLLAHDAAAALGELNRAAGEGTDLGQLLEQLLGYLRDCLLAAVGCPGEMFLHASPGAWPKIVEIGQRLGADTILAAMQIVDQTLGRLRFSTQGRILVELAIVRLCQLENLSELATLIAQVRSGVAPELPAPGQTARLSAPAEDPALKKNVEPPITRKEAAADPVVVQPASEAGPPEPAAPQVSGPSIPLSAENTTELWNRVVAKLTGLAADQAKRVSSVAISAPNRLALGFPKRYTFAKDFCERPENKSRIEQILEELTGQRVLAEFRVLEEPQAVEAPAPSRTLSSQHRLMQVSQHSMIRRATELFGAQPVRVEEPTENH